MTDPCITCGRECNNLPCQHCVDRSKPRTVGFLDIPLPAATPPTLEAALALPVAQALVEALREIRDMRPHHAGQTRNECLMQQIAGDALRKVEWK
jgi:hypothetical protein